MTRAIPLAQRVVDGEFEELDPRDFDSMKEFAVAKEELDRTFQEAVLEELGFAGLEYAEEIYRTGRAIAGSDRIGILKVLGHMKRLLVEMGVVPAKRRA